MDDLFAAAQQVEDVCQSAGFSFCFIGGIAVIRWGAPRVTRDLDISVLAGFGGEQPVIDTLLASFTPRMSDAAQFALQNRVLLLKTKQGIEIDVSLAALPFEEEMFRRASRYEPVKGITITTCSADDLVVMKAFAARPRDWSDIATIFEQHSAIDWDYVLQTLEPLAELKPEVAIIETLNALRPVNK
jgi:hypothetical protein